MNNKPPINDNVTTKLIPGLLNDYTLVSLPYWAWFWLEDFMKLYKISYQGIYETFGQEKDLNTTLHEIAELHHEFAMREVYHLANDNMPDNAICLKRIYKKQTKQIKNLPRIYKLFGFMPCATTLEAVWERRNYKGSERVK